MLAGTLYALAAGLMWGLVFVAPAMLPEYPATLQSFGRYLAFGLIDGLALMMTEPNVELWRETLDAALPTVVTAMPILG